MRKGGQLYVDYRNGSVIGISRHNLWNNYENFIKENEKVEKRQNRDFQKIIETYKKMNKINILELEKNKWK